MKTCFKCNEVKPVDEFYRHPQMGDGRLGKCKECTKVDVHANRRKRLDYYRQYDTIRFQRNAARRERQAIRMRAYRKANPLIAKAHAGVARATRTEKLNRQPCERCSRTDHVHGHHEDYSRPLDVMWLCPPCHAERHAELKAAI